MDGNGLKEKVTQLKSQVSTLEQLLEGHEQAVFDPSNRLEQALAALQKAYQALELLTAGQTAEPVGPNTSPPEQNTGPKQSFAPWLGEHSLLRPLIDNMPDFIFVKDTESRFVINNAAHMRVLKAKRQEELLGKTDYDIFPEELAARYYADEQTVIRSGQPLVDIEEPYIDETGKERWLSTTKTPLRDAGGKIVGLVGISRDITGRKRAEEMLAKRATELETVAQVSVATSTVLEAEKLLQKVVDLTKTSFGLYHAHIYLLNETGDTLNLIAGAGEVGRQMVAEGWSIPFKQEQSLVARAARTRQGVIVNDVRAAPDWLPNPLLPDTRSELAVPMIMGDRVLGVLDVQSEELDHFTSEDVRIQTTLAAQVAVALQNAQHYEQTRQASFLLDKRVKELNCLNDIGREMVGNPPLTGFLQWVTERIPPAMQYPAECRVAIEFQGQLYGAPEAIELPCQMANALRISGEVVGRVYISYVEKHDFLDEESALLGDIAGRVSSYIESRRLFEQTQATLAETESLYNASHRITSAGDLQELVAAVAEAVPVPVINRAVLQIFKYDPAGEMEASFVAANWYSGRGTPPTSPGVHYLRPEYRTIELFLSPEPIFFNDVWQDERIDPTTNELLHRLNIRAMAAVPLGVGPRQVGVLLLQAEEPHQFTEHEMRAYISLAEQMAIAVENRRLLEQTQAALAEVEATQRRYTVQAWEAYRVGKEALSYEKVRENVTLPGDSLPAEVEQAVRERRTLVTTDGSGGGSRVEATGQPDDAQATSSLVVPLTVRGEIIGVLGLQEADERDWSSEEIALVEAVGEQLAQAAESLRLLDETQQQAARETRINEIGARIREAQSLEEALQIAVKEVGLSLRAPHTTVQLHVEMEDLL